MLVDTVHTESSPAAMKESEWCGTWIVQPMLSINPRRRILSRTNMSIQIVNGTTGYQLTCLQYPYSHLPVFNHRNIPRGVLPVVYLRINVIGLRYKVLVLRIRRKVRHKKGLSSTSEKVRKEASVSSSPNKWSMQSKHRLACQRIPLWFGAVSSPHSPVVTREVSQVRKYSPIKWGRKDRLVDSSVPCPFPSKTNQAPEADMKGFGRSQKTKAWLFCPPSYYVNVRAVVQWLEVKDSPGQLFFPKNPYRSKSR